MNENLEKYGDDYYTKEFKADENTNKTTADTILTKLSAIGEAEKILAENSEEESNAPLKKYLVTDDSIVLVTYGKGTDAQRTFILNYNYFDVEVELEYNGKTITATVPAYGYVVENWR